MAAIFNRLLATKIPISLLVGYLPDQSKMVLLAQHLLSFSFPISHNFIFLSPTLSTRYLELLCLLLGVFVLIETCLLAKFVKFFCDL